VRATSLGEETCRERGRGDHRPARNQADPVFRQHRLAAPAQGPNRCERERGDGDLTGKRRWRSLRKVVELRRGAYSERNPRRSVEDESKTRPNE